MRRRSFWRSTNLVVGVLLAVVCRGNRFGPAVTEWLALWRDASGRTRLFAFTHGRGVWRVDLK